MTVPTALERVGDFSQTLIPNESGQPVPARIFDPFNVVQQGPDLYRRVEIPNARIPNPNPAALRMYSFYPLPNRTPDDVYNTNNFEASIDQTVRRYSSNSRVDYRTGRHSIYGSGGISYAEIVTPRPFGAVAVQRRRRHPRRQEPVRPDRRRGRARPDAAARRPLRRQPHQHEEPERRQDGLRRLRLASACRTNLQPFILFPGAAPNVNPNGLRRRGRRRRQQLERAHDRQLQHQARIPDQPQRRWRAPPRRAARGSTRPASSSATCCRTTPIPSRPRWCCRRRSHQVGGNFNFEYVTADGGVASADPHQRAARHQRRRAAARRRPVVDPPGRQRARRRSRRSTSRSTRRTTGARRSKLTINLGLRYEIQPGPTERFDRMSAWDLEAHERLRHAGRDRVPRRRRLQPQPVGHDLRQLGPARRRRLSDQRPHGAARRLRRHLPAQQHRLLLGPDRLRLRQLLGRREPDALRPQPGRRARRHASPTRRRSSPAIGGDPANAAASTASARRASTAHFKNGRVHAVERLPRAALGDTFMVSIGYSALEGQQPAQPRRSRSSRCRTSTRRRSTPGGRPYIASQRHAEPGDAAGAEPVPAADRLAAAVRRAARRRRRSRGRTRCSRTRC